MANMTEAKCQYCHRVLAKLNDDGSLNISGRMMMDFGFTVLLDNPELCKSAPGVPKFETAICLKWICRFKRWMST